LIVVVLRTSHDHNHDHWNTPCRYVVEDLQIFRVPVPPHNHLVKIECYAECPDEISQEKVVEDHGRGYAHRGVVDVERQEEEELGEEYTVKLY
jgi:hypothetical protein